MSEERLKTEKSVKLRGLYLGKERKQGDKYSKLRIHIRAAADPI